MTYIKIGTVINFIKYLFIKIFHVESFVFAYKEGEEKAWNVVIIKFFSFPGKFINY